MDWNLKATNSWNLSEFKQEAIPNIDAFDRSTSRGDFSIDLKLGRVSNSNGESNNQWKQPAAGVSKSESSLPSVSTKRARATNNGTQPVFCLADGCNTDLSNCRDYHRRHKVCEVHSKSPQVTIGGLKQRFCQQCSRFHSLEEFDEGKRSCRKRLDGHNRRRRKPQPDLLSRPGSFWSNYKGTQLLPFSSSYVHPSTTVVSPTWSGVVNSDANATTHCNLQQRMHMPSKQNLFFGSSLSNSYKGGKQFPFLQVDNNHTLDHQTASPPPVCQPLLRTILLSESSMGGGGGSYNMFCDRLTTTATQVQDSDCALSLLSSTQTQTSGNHLVQPNSFPLVQPLDPMDSVLVSNGRVAHDHSTWLSSGNKPPQPLPFIWD